MPLDQLFIFGTTELIDPYFQFFGGMRGTGRGKGKSNFENPIYKRHNVFIFLFLVGGGGSKVLNKLN